jgi:predicted TIM-barrel fold metal-dependent hydrolase
MRKNVEQFLDLPIGEDAKRKILHDNAARLFPIKAET